VTLCLGPEATGVWRQRSAVTSHPQPQMQHHNGGADRQQVSPCHTR
jgi:hypothetical protein